MHKVIFFFAGTGDDGEGKCISSNYMSKKESYHRFLDGVIRIYIKGCHKASVGGGVLFPDLDKAANNILKAFEGKILNLEKLRKNFNDDDGIFGIEGNIEDSFEVADITLEGFSRGAVTTFAVAKKLDVLDIPMHIIANQPVPGEVKISPRIYSRYFDLRNCRNIQSAHTFLACHDLQQGFVHNHFFQQMVAKFDPSVVHEEVLFPHQHHLDWFNNSLIPLHINKQLSKIGLTRAYDDAYIKLWYVNNPWVFYTPDELGQEIHGVDRDHPIKKDSFYECNIIDTAKAKISNFDKSITFDQAVAILAINELFHGKQQMEYIEFVLEGTKKSEKFVKIIGKVKSICDYLPHVTQGYGDYKKIMISISSSEYQQKLFEQSFLFLSNKNPSITSKENFVKALLEAEYSFRKKALGIERHLMRRLLKIITNFITHITGLGLVFNVINKLKTGNWLLFNYNRSENVVRDLRKDIFKDINELDSNKYDVQNPPPVKP